MDIYCQEFPALSITEDVETTEEICESDTTNEEVRTFGKNEVSDDTEVEVTEGNISSRENEKKKRKNLSQGYRLRIQREFSLQELFKLRHILKSDGKDIK